MTNLGYKDRETAHSWRGIHPLADAQRCVVHIYPLPPPHFAPHDQYAPIRNTHSPGRRKMTASAVFILDVKGKVIISRNYRGDVPMNCVERFSGHVLEADEADERPVWLEHGTTYVYIKYNNLYIMAVTTRNSNAAMILLFLYRLVEVRSSTILTWKHQR
jgi:hypothetical protein